MNTANTLPAVTTPKAPLVAGARPQAIVPSDIAQVWRFAELMAASGLAPKDLNTPEKVSVAILHGLEVGLSPMQAVQKIAVINGRPTIWGDAVLGIVRASRQLEWIKEEITGDGDEMVATCTVKRVGDPEPVSRSFSVADAKVAKLWGKTGREGQPTPWVTHPKRMLQMRARAFALRDVFPDVTGGLYIREELEGVEDNGHAPALEPPNPTTEPATPLEVAIEVANNDNTQTGEQIEWTDEPETEAASAKAPEPPDPDAAAKPDVPNLQEVKTPPAPAEDHDGTIPDQFRRKDTTKSKTKAKPEPESFNEANWIEDCAKAAAKATTILELAEVQKTVYVPHEAMASEKGRNLALGTFKNRAEELSPPDDTIDPAEFLRNLEGALSGIEAAEMLGDVKEKYLLPVKGKVDDATWTAAVKMYRDKVEALTSADGLAA